MQTRTRRLTVLTLVAAVALSLLIFFSDQFISWALTLIYG